MGGFPQAHDPRLIGCASCHLGDPAATDKNLAHKGMTLTPGNLSIVHSTCGKCHADIEPRIRASLMNTMSGVIAVDKFVFGESPDPNHGFDVERLGMSPADTHLRSLCASCHLGQEKSDPAPVDATSRGGGCSACHLDYHGAALVELKQRREPGLTAGSWRHHPDISIQVSEQACFGCHSRSGRISISYEGWHETLLDEGVAKHSSGWRGRYRILSDGRVLERIAPDVHFERGMQCIDCHVAAEIMGDGQRHAHEEDAVRISCADCHATAPPPSAASVEIDPETRKIIALRKLDQPGRRFLAGLLGRAASYPNVFLDGTGRVVLKSKSTGEELRPKSPSSACGRDIAAHQKLECRACHSAWAPQCVSCHTSFDATAAGWDHLSGKSVSGAWQEQAGNFLTEPPALGVETIAGPDGTPQERVATVVPGMVLSLKTPGSEDTFHRLYAPISPHTTAARPRDCRSCHCNPTALGYGRGRLDYLVQGDHAEWTFIPSFGLSNRDGLPLDAWIAFLREPISGSATRTTVRAFSLQEQRRILLVGACLQCHRETEPAVASTFANFQDYRSALSRRCILPSWAD